MQEDDKTRTHVVLNNCTMVSHYRIVEKIGAGGMGDIYLADDTKLDRRVALKFLSVQMCQDVDCRARFKREAKAVAKLNHPNIVTIHQVGEFNDRPYFAMEYVKGQSLCELITSGKLTLERYIELSNQILDGLDKAHLAGVVHRDIKPSNIVIDGNNSPKLIDFGLATVKGREVITRAGSTLGTIRYMSPEQARGETVDRRSDLFSFGSMLYEMIAGKAPFKGEHDAEEIYNITNETPEPMARYRSHVSEELQRIVSKLLERDVELRYQNASDVKSDLKRALEGESAQATKRPSIAVLPFANMSTDPEQEYFCDGISEDILNDLAKIDELRVVSRTSSFAFKGKTEDLRDVGRKLNAGTTLLNFISKPCVVRSGSDQFLLKSNGAGEENAVLFMNMQMQVLL